MVKQNVQTQKDVFCLCNNFKLSRFYRVRARLLGIKVCIYISAWENLLFLQHLYNMMFLNAIHIIGMVLENAHHIHYVKWQMNVVSIRMHHKCCWHTVADGALVTHLESEFIILCFSTIYILYLAHRISLLSK